MQLRLFNWSHLVHLVCGAVFTNPDGDGGLFWEGYP